MSDSNAAILNTDNTAWLLFAHGSQQSDWRVPFDALLASLKTAYPQKPIALAFLESCTPDFMTQVNQLMSTHPTIGHINIIPLFLARSRHTTRDIPALINTAHERHPALQFTVLPELLSSPSFMQFMTQWVIGVVGDDREQAL